MPASKYAREITTEAPADDGTTAPGSFKVMVQVPIGEISVEYGEHHPFVAAMQMIGEHQLAVGYDTATYSFQHGGTKMTVQTEATKIG